MYLSRQLWRAFVSFKSNLKQYIKAKYKNKLGNCGCCSYWSCSQSGKYWSSTCRQLIFQPQIDTDLIVIIHAWYESNNIWTNILKLIIIHAALTQPEHLILVRWMGLETQWKTSWKHGRVWKPVFETRMPIFFNLLINKATKTRGDKTTLFNHTFYETNFKPKLFTANVEYNGTVLKEPKTEKTILFLNLNSRSMMATSCLGSLSTLLYTSDLKWHWC